MVTVFLEFQHEDIGTKQLVLLTKVMEKIADSADEVTEVWMFNGAGKPNIFDIMFHCINNIEQKVFINQQIDDIFLYEYLLSQTCAFCSTLTNKHFQTLVSNQYIPNFQKFSHSKLTNPLFGKILLTSLWQFLTNIKGSKKATVKLII